MDSLEAFSRTRSRGESSSAHMLTSEKGGEEVVVIGRIIGSTRFIKKLTLKTRKRIEVH